MFVNNPKAFLFQNSDPIGSLKANVATAVVKQLSNLRLEVLLENRDALSRKVREEVSPTSSQWGFHLGSTYIRKVAFRDRGMIAEIQRKVVNRLRQVTAAMRQAGENEVAIIHSEADRKASQRLGQAQAVRPQIVGQALAEIQRSPEVAAALFTLLEIQATMKSTGKIILSPGESTGLLLNS
jgi:regulator of protease activity HflC (stomatin/prohibitin superfamily)